MSDTPIPTLPQGSLYRLFLAEREEVLKHKWLKSEEAGHDVGLESALVDWTKDHREKWRLDYLKTLR